MDIKEITELYLREHKKDGLVALDNECICALGDLMPCDNPQQTCEAVRLRAVPAGKGYGPDEEPCCEWAGEDHWHVVEDDHA